MGVGELKKRKWVMLPAAVLWLALATQVAAQSPGERVQAVAGALSAIGDRAAAGQWPQADDAYNAALDVMDIHQPALEAELGDPARTVFARIAGLLEDLDVALRAEDPARTRAVIGYMQAELNRLAPGLADGAVARAPTDTVLAWRQAGDGIQRLLAAGQFRDMRNASMDLVAAIERGGPAVANVSGPEGARWVNHARIQAMRLRDAALDSSASDGAAAGRLYGEAIAGLLITLGVLPAPTPTRPSDSLVRLHSLSLDSRVGDSVVLPVVLEGLPQVGLGSYRLRARWSPQALKLTNVAWGAAEGNVVRDDAAGVVELSLPPAPTGPRDSAILASLAFDVAASQPDASDYVPAVELAALEDAASAAATAVRLGDVPEAARRLARAYAGFVAGREQAGSLYRVLDGVGQAQPLADGWLSAVDLASQPAPTDVLAAAIADLPAKLDAALAERLKQLAPEGGIPLAFEVLSVTDTTGRTVPVPRVEPGLVRTTGAATSTPDPGEPTVPPEVAAGNAGTPIPANVRSGGAIPTESELAAAPAATPATGSLPPQDSSRPAPSVSPTVALVGLLLLAAAIGLVAVWWSQRPLPPPDEPSGEGATGSD
jgi:hypothetical protein